MSPRDTSTGQVLEQMVLPALRRGGYDCKTRVNIGSRLGGRCHLVDAIAAKGDRKWLVSMKWQQVDGTAEQKVPFEVMCLAESVLSGGHAGAYLVLGGEGWTLRDFYTSGGLRRYLLHADKVSILSLEGFVAKANQGGL